MAYVRRHANLAIGQPTAEEIKIAAGSAFPMPETIEVEVRGRELLSGLPRTVMLDSDDIRAALADHVQTDRRRGARDARPDAARAVLGHPHPRHPARRRRRAAARARRAARERDVDADADRRLAADLRRGRRRRGARGVRGDRAPPGPRPPPPALRGRACAGRFRAAPHDRSRQAPRHRPGRQPRVLRAGAQAARLSRDARAGAGRGRPGRHAAGLLDRARRDRPTLCHLAFRVDSEFEVARLPRRRARGGRDRQRRPRPAPALPPELLRRLRRSTPTATTSRPSTTGRCSRRPPARPGATPRRRSA